MDSFVIVRDDDDVFTVNKNEGSISFFFPDDKRKMKHTMATIGTVLLFVAGSTVLVLARS